MYPFLWLSCYYFNVILSGIKLSHCSRIIYPRLHDIYWVRWVSRCIFTCSYIGYLLIILFVIKIRSNELVILNLRCLLCMYLNVILIFLELRKRVSIILNACVLSKRCPSDCKHQNKKVGQKVLYQTAKSHLKCLHCSFFFFFC